jgi:Cytidylate kinase-like family
MSTVAISSTTGSLGDEVGLALARTLTLQFADREIIAVAAKRFHEDLLPLIHVTEERPKLLERRDVLTRRPRSINKLLIYGHHPGWRCACTRASS